MAPSKTVSTRLHWKKIAKAYDGLLEKGINPADITNISQILRLTFYYGIIYLCSDPEGDASPKASAFVRQLYNKTKMTKNIKMPEDD